MKKSLRIPVIVILVVVALASCSGINSKSMYDIKVDEYIAGGTVHLVANTFDAGSMVQLKVYPDPEMRLENLYYSVQGTERSIPIPIDVNSGDGVTSTSFQRPNASIVIKADFVSTDEYIPEPDQDDQEGKN